jgi:hypothetical protein
MTRSYKHIRRDHGRQYPHHVRLTHARLWRMGHVGAQLRHLQPRQWAGWHEGGERRGNDVGIWGFKCPVQAAALVEKVFNGVIVAIATVERLRLVVPLEGDFGWSCRALWGSSFRYVQSLPASSLNCVKYETGAWWWRFFGFGIGVFGFTRE